MASQWELKPAFFILFLLAFLLPYSYCQCQVCVDLSYYGCKVCYNNCTNVQSKMFQKCQYTYCAENTYDSNGSSSCYRYQTKQLTQAQCFPQCCAENVQQFSVQQLDTCDSKSKRLRTIAIAVSVSIFSVFVIIFILCWCRRGSCFGCRCGCSCGCCRTFCRDFGDCLCYLLTCRCCRRERVPPQQPRRLTSLDDISGVQMQRKITIENWQAQQKANEVVSDQNNSCAICLSNRADSLTKCGHYFHLQCIFEWFKRNPHCPLCKSQNVKDVKFFCRGCCIRYVKLDLRSIQNPNDIIQKIKGPNCRTCQ